MVRKPGAADRYGFLGEDQKMPPFGTDQVGENDLNMIIRYLRGDYPPPTARPEPGLDVSARLGIASAPDTR